MLTEHLRCLQPARVGFMEENYRGRANLARTSQTVYAGCLNCQYIATNNFIKAKKKL
jgi:hypothetical protein